ncbi:MAG: ORF6N domain-containing protein [Nitrospirota bacterium]
MDAIVPVEVIEGKIYLIRGQKVMLDRDLAQLYGVETRVLNQAVRRNIDRFPPDFMFPLTRDEIMNLSQIVISSRIKHAPNVFVFTEHGVSMLSSVLSSQRAVQVNIQIMRTFAKLREIMTQHKDLAQRLDELEKKYDAQFKVVFDAIRQLMAQPPEPKKRKIGFVVRERSAQYKTLSRKAVKK